MTDPQHIYNKKFHQSIIEGANTSAQALIPLFIHLFKPTSVVDVGCGAGVWLKTFKNNGVTNIKGLDGGMVNTENLVIDKSEFSSMDLNHPFSIDQKFDLAMTLETAEHLKPEASEQFVKLLTELSDIVIFSAAIPRQGGTNHTNEQFPAFWQKLFAREGFVFTDPLRHQILNNENIMWWYRQNIFVAIKEDKYKQEFQHLPLYNPDFVLLHKNIFIRYQNPVRLILYTFNNFFQNQKNKI